MNTAIDYNAYHLLLYYHDRRRVFILDIKTSHVEQTLLKESWVKKQLLITSL
jgi:hypothetical protein